MTGEQTETNFDIAVQILERMQSLPVQLHGIIAVCYSPNPKERKFTVDVIDLPENIADVRGKLTT